MDPKITITSTVQSIDPVWSVEFLNKTFCLALIGKPNIESLVEICTDRNQIIGEPLWDGGLVDFCVNGATESIYVITNSGQPLRINSDRSVTQLHSCGNVHSLTRVGTISITPNGAQLLVASVDYPESYVMALEPSPRIWAVLPGAVAGFCHHPNGTIVAVLDLSSIMFCDFEEDCTLIPVELQLGGASVDASFSPSGSSIAVLCQLDSGYLFSIYRLETFSLEGSLVIESTIDTHDPLPIDDRFSYGKRRPGAVVCIDDYTWACFTPFGSRLVTNRDGTVKGERILDGVVGLCASYSAEQQTIFVGTYNQGLVVAQIATLDSNAPQSPEIAAEQLRRTFPPTRSVVEYLDIRVTDGVKWY